jgi:N-acetylglucosamine-6-sulfatase
MSYDVRKLGSAAAVARRHWRLLIPLGLVASLVAPTALIAPPAKAAPSSPNVVIIMTDDQRWDTVTPQYMPHLTQILSQNPSITYTNSFVPNSLCCPSRTSTLTGDYSHTTGVYGNTGQWGGFSSFTAPPEGNSISSINDTTTIGVDMQQAGYRTALVGKYLNGYPSRGLFDYVPPGWNRWFAVGTGVYYDYYAAINGRKSSLFAEAPEDYITRVLSARARRFIEAPSAKPFFLYYATTAPHGPAIPDPRDVGRFDLNGYVRPPSFGKAEVGAPNYIQDRTWDLGSVNKVNSFHENQLNSNYGVDRSIGRIWNALPDNTAVLFMSDNGYTWGEHKWSSKEVPYNESLRVPIMLVGKNLQTPLSAGADSCPSIYSFTTSCDARIVLNVDVAPTLERIAGVTSGHAFEGLDMLTSGRSNFVLEHWNGDYLDVPTYCGVRSKDWMYVRYNRFDEPVKEGLYDENADPWEMNNLAVTDPNATELETMRTRAAALCQVDGGLYPNDWPFQG